MNVVKDFELKISKLSMAVKKKNLVTVSFFLSPFIPKKILVNRYTHSTSTEAKNVCATLRKQ